MHLFTAGVSYLSTHFKGQVDIELFSLLYGTEILLTHLMGQLMTENKETTIEKVYSKH